MSTPSKSAMAMQKRMQALLSVVFLGWTVSCGVLYLHLLSPSLTNNLYWPHYNVSGYESLLIDLVNVKLSIAGSDESVDLLSLDAMLIKAYTAVDVQPEFQFIYARCVLFTELNTVSRAIRDLRLNTLQPTGSTANSPVFGAWTSVVLYTDLFNDMWFTLVYNASMVRTAATISTPSASPSPPAPMATTMGTATTTNYWGCFTTALVRLDRSMPSLWPCRRRSCNSTRPFAPSWLETPELHFTGGSIFYEGSTANSYAYGHVQLSSRTVSCNAEVAAYFAPSKTTLLVAGLALGFATHANTTTVEAICATTSPRLCDHICRSNGCVFGRQHRSPTASDEAKAAVWTAQVSILEFGLVFDPTDPTYDFWSWCFAIEWVWGQREVASKATSESFTCSRKSRRRRPNRVHLHELPTAFALYARVAVQYATGVVLSVVVGLILYVVWCRGFVDGANLLLVNRVAGIVWVGRPLLLLRGVTALCFLSTATLELAMLTATRVVRFVVPDVPS
ncbi:Aste57867_20237 [Aphanomyces stellatus]|uniref:Aste57867_20237 protein n=1 Tax=Aphanomyces stellatus TaxID=120398 RepID=A0A485LEI1_9STRA|nr:hypothetical protein As57867_020171 [Aphanomyces stellatus]VFT96928.1 Aste57867_20237 [Aphanomyces stellatus]